MPDQHYDENTRSGSRQSGQLPRILIIQDLQVTPQGSTCHIDANYAAALHAAGALPLCAPFIDALIPQLLDLVDAVLLSGSAPGNNASAQRITFEKNVLESALNREMPVLGICHGMQVIGEYLGASIEDIDDPTAQALHLPFARPDRQAHEIQLSAGSWLRQQYGADQAWVNSFHRQSLTGCGDFLIAATAPDGTIEAIEGRGNALCIGLQWHPEFQLSALDRTLMNGFVAAAARYRQDEH